MFEPLRTAHPRIPISRRFLLRSLLNRTSVHRREVDKTLLHVRADQFHAYPIADVETLEPAHHSAFDRRADNAHPSALLRRDAPRAARRPISAPAAQPFWHCPPARYNAVRGPASHLGHREQDHLSWRP